MSDLTDAQRWGKMTSTSNSPPCTRSFENKDKMRTLPDRQPWQCTDRRSRTRVDGTPDVRASRTSWAEVGNETPTLKKSLRRG